MMPQQQFTLKDFARFNISQCPPVQYLEDMRLMLHVEKVNNSNNNFNPMVLDAKDFDSAVDYLLNSENRPEEGSKRIQLLVRSRDVHFTTVDMEISKDKTQALVLDAAGDPGGLQLVNRLNPRVDKCYMPLMISDRGAISGIQKDQVSCGIFAADQAIKVAGIDIYNYLERDRGIMTEPTKAKDVSWKDMPPELVYHAQTVSFLEDYKNTGNHSANEIAKLDMICDIRTDEQGKKRNVAIESTVAEDLKFNTQLYLNRQDVTNESIMQIASGQIQAQTQSSQIQNEQRNTFGK